MVNRLLVSWRVTGVSRDSFVLEDEPQGGLGTSGFPPLPSHQPRMDIEISSSPVMDHFE